MAGVVLASCRLTCTALGHWPRHRRPRPSRSLPSGRASRRNAVPRRRDERGRSRSVMRQLVPSSRIARSPVAGRSRCSSCGSSRRAGRRRRTRSSRWAPSAPRTGTGRWRTSGNEPHRVAFLIDPRGIGHSTPSLGLSRGRGGRPDPSPGLRLRDPARADDAPRCGPRLPRPSRGPRDRPGRLRPGRDRRRHRGPSDRPSGSAAGTSSPTAAGHASRSRSRVGSRAGFAPCSSTRRAFPSPDFLTIGPDRPRALRSRESRPAARRSQHAPADSPDLEAADPRRGVSPRRLAGDGRGHRHGGGNPARPPDHRRRRRRRAACAWFRADLGCGADRARPRCPGR